MWTCANQKVCRMRAHVTSYEQHNGNSITNVADKAIFQEEEDQLEVEELMNTPSVSEVVHLAKRKKISMQSSIDDF